MVSRHPTVQSGMQKTRASNSALIMGSCDGCSDQYKNKYNFYNMLFHEKDFELSVEWHFFATCHGKNECDGLGGTVKRQASKASLQRSVENVRKRPILNSYELYEFCKTQLSEKIKFFHVGTAEIEGMALFLEDRFQNAITIKGTRSFHKFRPLSTGLIACYAFSTDKSWVENKVHREGETPEIEVVMVTPKVGDILRLELVIDRMQVWYVILILNLRSVLFKSSPTGIKSSILMMMIPALIFGWKT